MNDWGENGIKEYLGLIDDRDNFAHYSDYGFDPEDIEEYDREKRGFTDEDNPDVLIDLYSEQGQRILYEYVRSVTEDEANDQFNQKYDERFLTEDGICHTAGCAAYWVNIWFAPETVLDHIKDDYRKIKNQATEILGISQADARELMTPNDDAIYQHARPSHVASVLANYLKSGRVSWENVIPPCHDTDCIYCESEEPTEE